MAFPYTTTSAKVKLGYQPPSFIQLLHYCHNVSHCWGMALSSSTHIPLELPTLNFPLQIFLFSKLPCVAFFLWHPMGITRKNANFLVKFCIAWLFFLLSYPPVGFMEKNEKSILALCNVLGSWHYRNQALTLASPCMGPCCNIAYGLGRYPIVHVKQFPK
jgi:hypothetical protein